MVDPADDRLDSWKAIAVYLGREVRTVQGWEKTEALPIHRHKHAKQGSVYAFKSEMDAWKAARKESPEIELPTARPGAWLPAALLAALLVTAASWGYLSWQSRRTASALTSVAVLPFLDLSPAKDQEYFSDGLTEEVIDALSRVPNLRVAARTSAFAFKGKAVDIREIGRQLNVTTVLEGSVRKSGDELRITAQLNRVSDGYHLWSQTYERRLSDIFQIQRELSTAISAQLRVGALPERATTSNLEAYRLYQEGHYFFRQHQVPESYYKAIDRYRQAIELDPSYAAAHAGLAESYAYLADQFVVPPKEVMPKAREAAEKAVALDDLSADAHTSLGMIALDYDWQVDRAQKEFLRAMQLNPSSGYIRHWYAHSLEVQNRLDEAIREMRAAQQLDPLEVVLGWDLASEYLVASRYDDALREVQKGRELFPNVPLLSYMGVLAYHLKGDLHAGRAVLAALQAAEFDVTQEPLFIALFGAQAAWEGRRDEARRHLDKLEQLRQTRYIDGFIPLELCLALNDREQTLVWLKRAYEDRSSQFPYLRLRRDFFAGNPEAEALVQRLR
jgi:TolB-like protein